MDKLIEGATADVAMRNLILEKEAAKRKDKIKETAQLQVQLLIAIANTSLKLVFSIRFI